MEAQVRAAMAKIDELYAQRTEESRQDWLTRHDEETVDAVFQVGARMWRTQRQEIETRLRAELHEFLA